MKVLSRMRMWPWMPPLKSGTLSSHQNLRKCALNSVRLQQIHITPCHNYLDFAVAMRISCFVVGKNCILLHCFPHAHRNVFVFESALNSFRPFPAPCKTNNSHISANKICARSILNHIQTRLALILRNLSKPIHL